MVTIKNIRMNIIYDGSRYLGWQRLGDSETTIQGKLEMVLERRFSKKINLIASSRTDKGVHSRGLVGNFHIDGDINLAEVEEYINRYLPEDIRVYNLEFVDQRFHSRFNAKSKIYRYRIDNSRYGDVFSRRYSYYIADELDLERMKAASSYLLGEHDFTSFTSMKSKKKSYIKNIYEISIEKSGDEILITYEGDGFLHNMIRIITGTLVRVGKKELEPEDLKKILEAKDRSKAGPMVDGRGLFLEEVKYGD